MEIIQEQINEVTLLQLKGRLDTSATTEFRSLLMSMVEHKSPRVLLDLSELIFISSYGLRILLRLAKKTNQRQGKLALCTMQDKVKNTFELSGFNMLFPQFQSKEEALSKWN